QIGVAECASGRLIGDVGLWLSPDSTTAEFGMSIARHAQGHGFGTHVAAELIKLIFMCTGVQEIVANTDKRNEPCIRALKRAGMSQFSTRTEEYKGEQCVELYFHVTRPAG